MRRKLIGLFVVLMVCMLPVIANAEVVKSGECGEEGDNVIWTLDDKGTLTISGTGDMKNYDVWSTAPWSADSSNIKNLIIKEGVTSIGNHTFFQCYYIESAAIPDSVASIGIEAFEYCDSLTSVDIPASVKSIGHSAFASCGLEKVNLSYGVPSIGNYAFAYCQNLTSVDIPNSIQYIGERAFFGCFGLTKANIPNSTIFIGSNAFGSCDLSNVNIPSGVEFIGDGAFTGCGDIYVSGNNKNYCDVDGVLFTKDKKRIICYNKTNSSYIIPDSVMYIGYSAFEGCEALKNVTIPDSVIFIGDRAFSGTGLTELQIPGNVKFTGRYAFSSCSELESITIGNGVTYISDGEFVGSSSLKSIKIPESVTKIEYAFSGTKSLTDAYFGGSEEQWEALNCNFERFVPYEDPVTVHFGVAINGSANPAPIPAKTDILADGTCKGSLSAGFLRWSFDGGNRLTISGNGEMGEYDYYNDYSYQWIPPWCRLQSCIKSIKISDGVTYIGGLAFDSCVNTAAAEIPESVTSIGWGAFSDCDSLKDIYYAGTKEQWESININEEENDDLLNAVIHYNSTMPEFIPLEVEPIEMTVNEAENKVEFAVTVTDASRAEELNEVELFFTKYDADGNFLGLTLGEKGVIDGNSVTITSDIPDTENYKFMLWDGNNVPLMPAVDNIKAE